MEKQKIIIIGSGPSGLSASIYSTRAGLKPVVMAGSPPGGQLTLTSHVENFPGYESILGPELILKIREQSKKLGTQFIDENVVSLTKKENVFEIKTGSGKVLYSLSVLVATGAEAMWIGLDSEKKLRGKGVSACATCDGFFFRDKVVAVIGGGDTAMEEAITLTKFAKRVLIIHRRDSFRASKIMQERVFANPKIEIKWNSQVLKILGENSVTGLQIKKDNSVEEISLDGVFVAIGHKPTTDFLKDSGILLDKKGYVLTSSIVAYEYARLKITRENKEDLEKISDQIKNFNLDYKHMTSVEGVFASGDVTDPRYQQASTASGMGVSASLEIEEWLNERKR